jgi:hypothetical protein
MFWSISARDFDSDFRKVFILKSQNLNVKEMARAISTTQRSVAIEVRRYTRVSLILYFTIQIDADY